MNNILSDNNISDNNILYNCNICYTNIYSFTNKIVCRLCNNSKICIKCFDLMKIKNDFIDICCPNCNNIYYGYLRNAIVKYALEYNLGIEYNTNLFNIFLSNKKI